MKNLFLGSLLLLHSTITLSFGVNPGQCIELQLANEMLVDVSIYDTNGNLVRKIGNTNHEYHVTLCSNEGTNLGRVTVGYFGRNTDCPFSGDRSKNYFIYGVSNRGISNPPACKLLSSSHQVLDAPPTDSEEVIDGGSRIFGKPRTNTCLVEIYGSRRDSTGKLVEATCEKFPETGIRIGPPGIKIDKFNLSDCEYGAKVAVGKDSCLVKVTKGGTQLAFDPTPPNNNLTADVFLCPPNGKWERYQVKREDGTDLIGHQCMPPKPICGIDLWDCHGFGTNFVRNP